MPTNVLTETVEDGDDFERGFKVLTQDSGPFQRSLQHMEQRNSKLMSMETQSGSRVYRRYDGKMTVNQS